MTTRWLFSERKNMQLFRVGFVSLLGKGEIHLGFTVEEKCREWIAANNLLTVDYAGLPSYCFLGAL